MPPAAPTPPLPHLLRRHGQSQPGAPEPANANVRSGSQAPINYEEDTEFNDALRRHGIIPPKESSGSRSPSPPPAPPSPTLSELDLDDLSLAKDDATSRQALEEAFEKRREREKETLGKRRFGRVYPIGKVDYKREVTEASNEELPGEPEGWGTGVVCVLFKDRCVVVTIGQPALPRLATDGYTLVDAQHPRVEEADAADSRARVTVSVDQVCLDRRRPLHRKLPGQERPDHARVPQGADDGADCRARVHGRDEGDLARCVPLFLPLFAAPAAN